MEKVRWGILSTADIAVESVIPAMQKGQYSEIVAIASRDLKRAQQVARQLNIPKAYGSYDELLDDPEIDAIYNPLPNHLHVLWSIKALQAGKHVLCEKPLSLSSTEGMALVSAAKERPTLKLMEAFMYRHHPQWQRTKQLVEQGKIGELRTINSFFSFFDKDPQHIVNIKEFGGGGLMDIGCYSISLSRFIFNDEPKRVFGVMEFDPDFHVDRLTSGILEFDQGTSTFTCAIQLTPYQHVDIFGTEGRIELPLPFNPPTDKPYKIIHEYMDKTEEIVFDVCNQYTIQGDLFSQAIINDTPVPTPIEDAIENMKLIEAIFCSAELNSWILC